MLRPLPVLALLLAGCLCPRDNVVQPRLEGRIVDDTGAPRPDAQAEVCLAKGDKCDKLDVSSAATFSTPGRTETAWGCLCLPEEHTEADYVLRVSAPDTLAQERQATAGEVVLQRRPVDAEQAKRALVLLYRSPNGFSVVLTAGGVQEATPQGFSLRAGAPGELLDRALAEVERSGVVSAANRIGCRQGVGELLTATDPFLVRYGPTWYFLRNPPQHSPLRRVLARLQPGTTESQDEAPAARALARGDAERAAQEVCGAAVGAPGGVALR